MPESLPKLLSLTKGLAWLTVVFDGLTSFEPSINEALDDQIERLYHETMDKRITGGDSRAGTAPVCPFKEGESTDTGGGLVRLGSACPWTENIPTMKNISCISSCIFSKSRLRDTPPWMQPPLPIGCRSGVEQIQNGELVYIAHQMDFLARV